MIETTLLLILVIDPFGNLPVVLSVLDGTSAAAYRRTILRETLLAFLVLVVFTLAGEPVLDYLNVERSSLVVAGGVILFLISLKMTFRSSAEIFEDSYGKDPLLVPIAIPSLAGPSAITTVMVLRTQQADLGNLLSALVAVFLVTCAVFLAGRELSSVLGRQGMRAMEKLMGLLLNLLAVDMILEGAKEFLAP